MTRAAERAGWFGTLCLFILTWAPAAGAAAPWAGGEDEAPPPAPAAAAEPESARAQEAVAPADETYTLDIRAEEDWTTFRFEAAGVDYTTSCDPGDARHLPGELQIGSGLWITSEGIVVAGRTFSTDRLVVEELDKSKSAVHVVLRGRAPDGPSTRRGRIAAGETLHIEEDDFVRGDAICFGGDIRVSGEVNHDVVVVFGDVSVTGRGLVGGDVAAIGGRVSVHGDGRVRGEILTPRGRGISRQHRVGFDSDHWVEGSLQGTGHYNRVDGLHLNTAIRAADADSVLPTLHAAGGYAFEAERWRYSIGARQRIGDRWAVALGGSFLRRTATDDDWLSPEDETSVAALLVTEDMRDYYEEEGGRGYVTFYPAGAGEVGASYAYMQLDWMNRHPRLWSLFGGDKEFRENFSSVPAAERAARRGEFEGSLGEFCAWYAIDTRDDPIDPWEGWWGRLEYRKAGDDFRGDLDFERFTAEVRRFQPLGGRISVNARVKYGTSRGDLPLMRAFYLGGLRTVRGIDHKSLRGEEMLLGNLEYVVETGLLETRTALFLDAGRTIARDEDLFDGGEFVSAVGLRLILDEDLQVEVAKSLNDADEPVHVWAMLARTF